MGSYRSDINANNDSAVGGDICLLLVLIVSREGGREEVLLG